MKGIAIRPKETIEKGGQVPITGGKDNEERVKQEHGANKKRERSKLERERQD